MSVLVLFPGRHDSQPLHLIKLGFLVDSEILSVGRYGWLGEVAGGLRQDKVRRGGDA